MTVHHYCQLRVSNMAAAPAALFFWLQWFLAPGLKVRPHTSGEHQPLSHCGTVPPMAAGACQSSRLGCDTAK